MDKTTHEVRLAHWTSIITSCRQSGMTVKAWCLENDVNEKRFYYWQRRIREATCKELQLPSTPTTTFVAVPDKFTTHNASTGFFPDIVLKSGNTVIEVSNSVSPQLLESLLRIVNHVG